MNYAAQLIKEMLAAEIKRKWSEYNDIICPVIRRRLMAEINDMEDMIMAKSTKLSGIGWSDISNLVQALSWLYKNGGKEKLKAAVLKTETKIDDRVLDFIDDLLKDKK